MPLGQSRLQRLRIHLIRRRLYRQSRSNRPEAFHLLLVPVCQLCKAGAKVRGGKDEDRACKARKEAGYAKVCGLQVHDDVALLLTSLTFMPAVAPTGRTDSSTPIELL